jgi:molybdenum cofactor sulfurtransferase
MATHTEGTTFMERTITNALPLAHLRACEYARLDVGGHVYLDYTGGALYAASHVQAHLALLLGGVFGNPHSTNPTSEAATTLADRARRAVLGYFNAAPDEYEVIFTANASGALKLVGEAYPFHKGGRCLLTVDNHNSVNGLREYARARGAATRYVPLTLPDFRIDATAMHDALEGGRGGGDNLLAYPAQSNVSGVQHDLGWIVTAQAKGWDVLLDAAAFVPTNRLDLNRWHPDFVTLSFYKMFGYPTGVGCLLARRASLAKLQRPWFAGGTVAVASVHGDGHVLHDGSEAFEDGTINYLALPAVETGLDFLASLGIDTIHAHISTFTARLLANLAPLRHGTGTPLARIYGPRDTERRGGTITFNLLDGRGNLVDIRQVEQRATEANISLRTGCFCNPGTSETISGLTSGDLVPLFRATRFMTRGDYLAALGGRLTGAVRVSVGLPTNDADIERFIACMKTFLE